MLNFHTVALLLTVAAPTQVGRSEKVSESLEVTLTTGDVETFVVSSDGALVVYRAAQDSDVPGLYAETPGAPPVLLSEPGASVGAIACNSAGTHIVFVSGPNMYRAGANGVRVQLNPPLPPGGSVADFVLSPDGNRAVYRANQEDNDRTDVYSVNLSGTPASVRLSRVGPSSVQSYWIAPGGQRVVYAGRLISLARVELFSAPIDGSQPDVALCGTFVAGGNVQTPTFAPTPDGTRVVYLADQLVDEQIELFSVPIDGSAAPLRLNGALPGFGDVGAFELAPVGGRVAFSADASVDHQTELFSAFVEVGGSAVPLAPSVTPASSLRFAPSGQRVLFLQSGCYLWSVPADGSAAPVQLSVPGQDCANQPSISPDSTTALYLRSDGTGRELLRVPLDGSGPPVEVDPSPGVYVTGYRYAPDGHTLLLRTHAAGAPTHRLASVPLDGSAPAEFLHDVALGGMGAQDDPVLLANGQVFFRADIEQREVLELHTVPLDGSQAPQRLNEDLFTSQTTTDVISFAVAPDGGHVAYGTGFGAHLVELTTPPVTRTLMGDLSGAYNVAYEFTPDGNRLFWRGPGSYPGPGQSRPLQVFSTRLDVIQPVVQVSPDFGGVIAFQLSPDGSRLTFDYDYPSSDPGPTFTSPSDLSSPPVQLSSEKVWGLLHSGSDVVYRWAPGWPYFYTTNLRLQPADGSAPAVTIAPISVPWEPYSPFHALTPDGTRVLYLRDDLVAGRTELFSAPVSAGAAATRINRRTNSGVSNPNLTPDGTRVLFVTDRDVSGAFELYVAPVEGNSQPLELSGTIVSGGDVAAVWVTLDSNRALYVADATIDDRWDLYGVPLDGSQTPTLLAASQVPDGDVGLTQDDLQLTPDGTRIVFRGDLLVNNQSELFCVPVTGGPVTRLSGAMPAGGDVELPFLLLAETAEVLYRADYRVGNRLELWAAPYDRAGWPARRSALALSASDVEPDFAVDALEDWVYYRADAEVDERFELYRHPLHPIPRPKLR